MSGPDGTPPLSEAREGPVAILTLSRPERHNPLSRQTRRALAAALTRAVTQGCRVVLVQSAVGRRPAFAAGADLREIARLCPATSLDFAAEGQALMRRVEDLPAVVIAAVDGPCRGGALDLCLAADLVVATPRASFAHPGARLGLVTGWGGTRRLPMAVGEGGSRALFSHGGTLSGAAALEAGLVDRLVAEVELEREVLETCRRWADALGRRPPGDVAWCKSVLAAQGPGRHALDAVASRLLAATRRRT